MRRLKPNYSGFTLVEMIAALAVTSLILLGATALFVVQNRQASVQDGTDDILAAAQVAADLLERDIRMAGFGVAKAAALRLDANAPAIDPLRAPGTDALFVAYSTTRANDYYYYIGKSGGLWRDEQRQGSAELIAANIDDLQASQSIINPGSGAPLVTVQLLVRSTKRDQAVHQPPQLADGTTRPADNYRRRSFTLSATPRNIGLQQEQ